MRTFIISIFLIGFSVANGQTMLSPEDFEAKIIDEKTKIDQSKDDNFKIEQSNRLIQELVKFYQTKEAFEYPFDKVKNIGFTNSPDKQVKIVNWNIERQDFTNQYFGLIVRFEPKEKEYLTYILQDQSDAFDVITEEYYTNENWYGALYYKIIPTKIRNKQVYTVLGYDANNKSSQIKLIDAFAFVGKKVKFGYSFFQNGPNSKKNLKRIVFEYSKKAYMALKYEPERNRIVFDHLSPEDPSMVEFRQFYVPDMSYDAFTYDGDRWNINVDIIAINAKEEKGKTYTSYGINKDGKMVGEEKKSKWIDPTNKNTHGGEQNIHTPSLPEDSNNKKLTQKKEKNPRDRQKTKKLNEQNTYTPYEVILKSKNRKKRHR